MNFIFLGTGTPDFFCENSASEFHTRAKRAGGRNWRYPSMLYIEPDCLIDFSRKGVSQIKRAGIRREDIKHLLITHSHDDHFDAESIADELEMAGGLRHVYGNEIVCKELCLALKERKLSADSSVHILKPFHEITIGDMKVIPLKANHCLVNEKGEAETSLNFILRGQEFSFLYLIDTALIHQETHEFIRRFTYDGVVIDGTYGYRTLSKNSGHLNFKEAMEILEMFEREGVLFPNARKIISHISTGSVDLHEKITPQLAKQGYTLAYDGMKIKFSEKLSDNKKREMRVRHKKQALSLIHI